MANDGIWVFVDDYIDEANAFAEEINGMGLIRVEVLTPLQARTSLLHEKREPAGVLMDVDFARVRGEVGTGPGIAQDIRTKQKAKKACEFPIARFSGYDPVARNVLGDPSSDDLFEIAVFKEDFNENRYEIVGHLLGLRETYDALIDYSPEVNVPEFLEFLFGLKTSQLATWGHDGLNSKILTGLQHAPHVAAGVYCRSFLLPTGLLIDEHVLAVRLGVDLEASGGDWESLKNSLFEAKFVGIGAKNFQRWWAHGMEDWWFTKVDSAEPLSSRTAVERVDLLRAVFGLKELQPINPKFGQTQTRFWRLCRLGLELRPKERIPVDPADSVRLTTQMDQPSWVEPYSASAKLAFRNRRDPRLNSRDLHRLQSKYGVV